MIAAVIMFSRNAITAEQLIGTITTLTGIVIGGTALEDFASKWGS